MNAVHRAKRQYESFSHLKADRVFAAPCATPIQYRRYGWAEAIGYRSNKFNGQWKDYIHHHDGDMHPEIWVSDQNGPIRIKSPKFFAFLGFALDLQFYQKPGDPVKHLDFGFPKKETLLCGDGQTNRLYLLSGSGVMILSSPILQIKPEGITH